MKRTILLSLGLLFCLQTVELNARSKSETALEIAKGVGGVALTLAGVIITTVIQIKIMQYAMQKHFSAVSNVEERFDDVAGIPEAISALKYVVDYIDSPEKYSKVGAQIPKGILLHGPPGTGKTLLARAIAGESNCAFIGVSAPELIDMFVGGTEANIRGLFSKARSKAWWSGKPCIVFIDEIDAIGSNRGNASGIGANVVNQLLVEMDGFDSKKDNIIIVGATNRPDSLDEALLRPGRFDQLVAVNRPDAKGRAEVLEVHLKKIKYTDIDIEIVALNTPGFSGAQLSDLVNKAAITASKKGLDAVTMAEFSEARDQMLIGERNETRVLNKEDLKVTAYHEAGHALMVLLAPEQNQQLHQITICPRGNTLGLTSFLPLRETFNSSREEMLHYIRVALGGRAAEEMVFDLISTGAYGDFKQATEVARSMICDYGMTDEFGKVIYTDRYSATVEALIKEILDEQYKLVIDLLKKNRDKLDLLSQKLLEKDTLDACEVYELLQIDPPQQSVKIA